MNTFETGEKQQHRRGDEWVEITRNIHIIGRLDSLELSSYETSIFDDPNVHGTAHFSDFIGPDNSYRFVDDIFVSIPARDLGDFVQMLGSEVGIRCDLLQGYKALKRKTIPAFKRTFYLFKPIGESQPQD